MVSRLFSESMGWRRHGSRLVSGLLRKLKEIPALLAGIITMTGLYSITNRVMGAPTSPCWDKTRSSHPISSHGTDQKQCRDSCRLSLRRQSSFLCLFLFPYRDRLSVANDGRQFSYEQASINTDNLKIIKLYDL